MALIIIQIIIVLLLTLASGFFSGSEIALISIRKTRVAALVKRGSVRAKIIQELQKNPETLFATTQIGISLLTIFASAFASTNFAQKLSPLVARIPWSFTFYYSYDISFVIIVILVSYISLLFGELVPKNAAIRYSERFALWAAYPVWWFSKLFWFLIKFLNLSFSFILKPMGQAVGFAETKLSEEEIRTVIAEGRSAGTIEPREQQMLENVFEFSDLSVNRIMIPRRQITAYDIAEGSPKILSRAVESGYSRTPIYRDKLDNVVGILYTKHLLPVLEKGQGEIDLEKYLLPAFYVPSTQKISDVMQQLQKNKIHMALVTNEHGEVEGLVTLEDIVEEIVGDISDESDEARRDVIREKDGSFVVKGEMSVVDFNKYFQSELPEDEHYTTVSGFILAALERFPNAGDVVDFQNLQFTVKEKTERAVKEVIVRKKPLP